MIEEVYHILNTLCFTLHILCFASSQSPIIIKYKTNFNICKLKEWKKKYIRIKFFTIFGLGRQHQPPPPFGVFNVVQHIVCRVTHNHFR